MQEDSYRGDPTDPLSLNYYTYCKGNPLIYSDRAMVGCDEDETPEEIQESFEEMDAANEITREAEESNTADTEVYGPVQTDDSVDIEAGANADPQSVIDSLNDKVNNKSEIRALTPQEQEDLNSHYTIKYIPISNAINDAKIAFTGTDLYGYAASDNLELQNAKLNTVINVFTLGISSGVESGLAAASEESRSLSDILTNFEDNPYGLLERNGTPATFDALDIEALDTGNYKGMGKGANNLKPDPRAYGYEHSTLKIDPITGKTTNYETYKINTNVPIVGLESEIRYDGIGGPHVNKVTLEDILTPHVHDPKVPGGIRLPNSNEIP